MLPGEVHFHRGGKEPSLGRVLLPVAEVVAAVECLLAGAKVDVTEVFANFVQLEDCLRADDAESACASDRIG